MYGLMTKAPGPTNHTSSLKDFLGLIQTIVEVHFPVHLRVKKIHQDA